MVRNVNTMKKVLLTLSVATLAITGISFGVLQRPVYAAGDGEVMFLFDASSSMLIRDDGGATRIEKAKNALSSTLDTIPTGTKVGLRFYGSQVPDTDEVNGCQDTQLIAKPKTNNIAALKSSVAGVQAKGWTLMGKALQDIQGDFEGDGDMTVILISDGIDTCTPPSACEVAKNLTHDGSKIKVNTVGLLVSAEARAQLNCIAANSGGNYYDINDINKLQETLIALAKREVTFFKETSVPIEGSTVLEKAPFMLANTLYTDTLVVPEQLYYGYDALPEQEVTITIKASNPGLIFKPTEFMRITGYNIDTGEILPISGTSGTSENFNYNEDSLSMYYKVNTGELGLTKPTRLAFKIMHSSTTGNRFDGTEIPLEMKITTVGGKAVDHQEPEQTKTVFISPEVKRALITGGIMATLLGIAVYVILVLKQRGVFDNKEQL